MKRFNIAIRAFFRILFDKDHLYSDNESYSIVGSRDFVWRNILTLRDSANDIIEQENDEIEQENTLNKANQILNN